MAAYSAILVKKGRMPRRRRRGIGPRRRPRLRGWIFPRSLRLPALFRRRTRTRSHPSWEGEILEAPFEEGDVVGRGQGIPLPDRQFLHGPGHELGPDLRYTCPGEASRRPRRTTMRLSQISAENASKATESGYLKKIYIEAGGKVGGTARRSPISTTIPPWNSGFRSYRRRQP